MDVKRVKISEIHEDPANSRKHGERNLATIRASLEQFGQVEPLVVQARTGVVIGGNGRLATMRKMGIQEVDIVEVDLTDVQAAALSIALNRTAELAEWNIEALAKAVAGIKDEVDLASLGWDPNELEQILGAGNADLTDPDTLPEPPAQAFSRTGDLWILGDHHRVLNGDATKPEDLDRLMDGKVADLVFTDPPYGVDYEGKTADALKIQNDLKGDLEPLLRGAFGEALRVCREGAGWYVCAPSGVQFHAFAGVLKDLGIWRQTLAWVKDSMVLGHSDYHYRHESIFYGWKPGAAHHPPPDRAQTTVWEFPRPKASREHPTMKPVALVGLAIANSTQRGDLVLDPFLGSGSTLMAAHEIGRRCYGLEVSGSYTDVIVKRFYMATGVGPRLERDGRILEWPEILADGFGIAAGAGGVLSASEVQTTPSTSVTAAEPRLPERLPHV